MRRLLCLLGFHHWKRQSRAAQDPNRPEHEIRTLQEMGGVNSVRLGDRCDVCGKTRSRKVHELQW